jgi:hypothetical protein
VSVADRQEFVVHVTPSQGDEYTVDLSEFALGGTFTSTVNVSDFSGPFSGRPAFAREMVMLFMLNPSWESARSMRGAVRILFRYLDGQVRRGRDEVETSGDLKDADGVRLRQWLGGSGSAYDDIRYTLNRIRALSGIRMLFWPARRQDRNDTHEMPDEEGLRRLFHAIRHEGRSIKAMFAEGVLLASKGTDPRQFRGNKVWKSPENRAWLVRHFLQSCIPDRDMLAREKAMRMVLGAGATYQAPGMDDRYIRGLVGALRWFVPSRSDTIVFFWLFLLCTGKNPSTACGVDVLDPDGWSQPHPQSDKFVVIHAFKRRAAKHQFTISMTKPEWHPYRILLFMIEVTEPLRRHVLADLADLRRRAGVNPTLKLAPEIARLERLSRTPWLFATRGKAGGVSGLIGEDHSFGPLDVARKTAERAGLFDKHPSLASLIAKDARKAWIGHAYVQSGYHTLLTQIAGNHASLRSTRHYIRSHRYRAYSERQIRLLQDAVFAEIEGGRVLDPTRLRLLVENGKITPEQEARLADYRQRSRLGMGCLDPRSPPKEIDPDHRHGALCRVQRCTGCPHGIVFPESMPPLARRYAEFVYLKGTTPLASWTESSLADEHASIEETLAHFDPAGVAAQVTEWSAKLESREIAIHGTYPSY